MQRYPPQGIIYYVCHPYIFSQKKLRVTLRRLTYKTSNMKMLVIFFVDLPNDGISISPN